MISRKYIIKNVDNVCKLAPDNGLIAGSKQENIMWLFGKQNKQRFLKWSHLL